MANVLTELFGNMANAIREKTGDTGTMKPAEFPDKIRSIETGGALASLTVTENGTYLPITENFEAEKTFLFRNDYTQAELKALYDSASSKSDDGVYAHLCNTVEGSFGISYQYGYYGAYISTGYIWIPAEIAAQLGVVQGWYFGSDVSNITPTDTPSMLLHEGEFSLYVNALSDLNPLFELAPIDGFSSVSVNVSSNEEEKELVFAQGDYESNSETETLTITHNLGVVPDIIMVFMTGPMPTSTGGMITFSMTAFSKKLIPAASNVASQHGQMFFVSGSSYLSASMPNYDFTEASTNFIAEVNETTFKVGSNYARHFVGNTYHWRAIGNVK